MLNAKLSFADNKFHRHAKEGETTNLSTLEAPCENVLLMTEMMNFISMNL